MDMNDTIITKIFFNDGFLAALENVHGLAQNMNRPDLLQALEDEIFLRKKLQEKLNEMKLGELK